jgi:hypothetical protein
VRGAGQEADSQREPLFCRYWAPPGAAEVSSTCDMSVITLSMFIMYWHFMLRTDMSVTDIVYFEHIWECKRPPLWYSGHSSWLQIHRPGFDYRHYQIFWEVVDLERGLLSLVSTTEEQLERKVTAPV